MKFGVPMIWREPLCHTVDCYFCLSKSIGFGKSAKWVYAAVTSVSLPIPHSTTCPHPTCPDSNVGFSGSSQEAGTSSGSEFEPKTLQRFTQFMRDLDLKMI